MEQDPIFMIIKKKGLREFDSVCSLIGVFVRWVRGCPSGQPSQHLGGQQL